MDQEKLKVLLRSFIQETENQNVTSADELINHIVNEFQKSRLIATERR